MSEIVRESIVKRLSSDVKDIPYKTTQKLLKLTAERMWGDKFKVSGQENIPATGSAIIAVNHPTYIDESFLIAAIDRPMHFIGRQQKSFNPLYVKISYSLLRVIGASKNMKEGGKQFIRRVDEVVKDKELICIFPEILDQEEKENREDVGEFGSGVVHIAKKYGLQIIPVYLHGTQNVRPDRTKKVFSRMYVKPVEIVIGKPISASEVKNAEQVRQAVIGLKNNLP